MERKKDGTAYPLARAKSTVLREIRKAKAKKSFGPSDAHGFAMGFVADAALKVADGKHNTPGGLKAMWNMRLAMAALRDM